MGVDAVIRCQLTRPVTDKEIKQWSYRLGDAAGSDFFWLDRAKGRMALNLREDYEAYPEKKIINTVLEVSTMSRYYGPGYERGDWPRIAATLIWMTHNLPGVTYYGGDNCDDLLEATPGFIQEMFDYWSTSGHIPYRFTGPVPNYSFSIKENHPYPWPVCGLCDEQMSQCGFGTNYANFVCLGCGYTRKTRDNGATWLENDKEMF